MGYLIFIETMCFKATVTGADIPIQSELGGGLLIPRLNGIVIPPCAVVDVNCLVCQ